MLSYRTVRFKDILALETPVAVLSSKLVICLMSFLIISLGATILNAETAPKSWGNLYGMIVSHIDKAHTAFKEGKIPEAKEILADAYFEKFEAYGMEMEVRKHLSAARAYQLEKMFGAIRKAMTKISSVKVGEGITTLVVALKNDAAVLDEKKISLENAGYITTSTSDNSLDQNVPTTVSNATQVALGKVAQTIVGNLDLALEQYRNGDKGSAKTTIMDTYFDVFEGGGLEAQIAAMSGNTKSEMESKFGALLGLIDHAAPDSQMESAIKDLSDQVLNVTSEIAQPKGWWQLFLASLFIILREGFEAILVISAIIAYLVKTNNNDKVKVVGLGSLGAIVLSGLTAVALLFFYRGNTANQEALEGITMLVASAVLFYVSFWLTSKAEGARWSKFIQNQVSRSISTGNVAAIGFMAFIVVYREGAETILFYAALYSNAGIGNGIPITTGFLAGVVLLLFIYYAFKLGTAKVPLGPFFLGTSTILFFMAFVFAGDGVAELQIAGLFSVTPIEWAPRLVFLGIYPTLESIALQSLVIFAGLGSIIYLFYIQSQSLVGADSLGGAGGR